MKKIYLTVLLLCSVIVCNAQIDPPEQIDTLIITSVKYNYADIYDDNWPYEVIYKSTKDFRIDSQVFNIVGAEKLYGPVIFTVYDSNDPTKKEYELRFYEDKEKGIVKILFSGYEFICFRKGYVSKLDRNEDETAYAGPSVVSFSLDGRKASHLKIPAHRCYGEGEVTVIVAVNPQGQVIEAQVFDEVSTNDQCLRNFAVRAARLSRFSASATAPKKQTGEIVYAFMGSGNTEPTLCGMEEPNAKLAGRSVNGSLPRPHYTVQKDGIVVVEIWVDNYGNVQKAVAGAEGTTVTDKTLLQAARKAALGAHFNMSADAPALQKGTITYTFTI